jgi:hypothetical protein
MKNFFAKFFGTKTTPETVVRAPFSTDDHIRELVKSYGNDRTGLYILKRAFLRAHGAPGSKARILLVSTGRTIDPRKTRKAKAIIAAS